MIKRIIHDTEYRLLAVNIAFSIFLKGASLILSLINTRLYILYFNNDYILGGWYSVVSILNWILYFDLGIGNGLRNEIVEPLERKDYKTAKELISTGYVVIGTISIAIIIVGCAIIGFIPWNRVLNIPSAEIDGKLLTLMIMISIIGVGSQFLFKIILSVYHAMRKTAMSGITSLFTNAILSAFLLFASFDNAQNALIAFAIMYAIATNIPLIIISVAAFGGKLKNARPSIRYFRKETSKKITTLGMTFFVIQVALLVISSTDSWLISYFFSPDLVVEYQVYYRFFSIALTVFALFSQTMWSSVTKYAKEQNVKRIRVIYRFLVLIAIIGGAACTVLACSFKFVVSLWMEDVFNNVSIVSALLFSGWMTMQMIINASTSIANGLGNLKCQSIFVPLAGAIKIIGIILMAKCGYDWNSVIYMNIIALIPLAIAQHISINRELNSKGRYSI